MLTAYDYPSASIADKANVDLILIGDSAANVIHGLKSTKQIGMDEMLLHTKAVARVKPKAKIIADMPYKSYSNSKVALKNAKKFLKEGADAVKIEGAKIKVIETLVKNKIKVMGHLGYLPQSGKPKIAKQETKLLAQAKKLQKAGCLWIVLELVPEKIAKKITEEISVPTIGIGAGKYCSGQVLVFHDLLGLNPSNFKPKFLKQYASLGKESVKAVKKYAIEVREGKFPGKKNTY
tara:strand:+ start:11269 stop:11973 length:705 start_codon:yes stop_codon:yes gene_type:complete